MSYRGEVTSDDIALIQSVVSEEGGPHFYDAFDGGKIDSVRDAVHEVGILPVLARFREWYPFRAETFALVDRYRSTPAVPDLTLVRGLLGGTYAVNYRAWLRACARVERMVCEIRDGDQHLGTGFLIGDDLVVTAGHVLKDCGDLSRVRLIFDALTMLGCTIDVGLKVKLAATMPDDANAKLDPLDVIVLRIDSGVGSMTLGVNAEERSWFPLPDLAASDGQLVSLVHRPRIGAYDLSPGVFKKLQGTGDRFLYDADSDSGSSGGAVMDLLTCTLLGVHTDVPIDSPFRRATAAGVVRKILEGEGRMTLNDPPVALLGPSRVAFAVS